MGGVSGIGSKILGGSPGGVGIIEGCGLHLGVGVGGVLGVGRILGLRWVGLSWVKGRIMDGRGLLVGWRCTCCRILIQLLRWVGRWSLHGCHGNTCGGVGGDSHS